MNSNKSYWYIFKIFEMNIYLIFFLQNVSRNSAFDIQRNSRYAMAYSICRVNVYSYAILTYITMGSSLTINKWHVNNIMINISLIIQFYHWRVKGLIKFMIALCDVSTLAISACIKIYFSDKNVRLIVNENNIIIFFYT